MKGVGYIRKLAKIHWYYPTKKHKNKYARLQLPSEMWHLLGVTEENPYVEVTFDTKYKRIIIKKSEESEENL